MSEADFARILGVLRTCAQALAGESREYDIGWGVRTRQSPRLWTLNQLCVTTSATRDEVVAHAEIHQADLTFRHVNVDHEPTGRQLERPLREAGWRIDREVMMLLTAEPDRRVDTSGVVELTEDQMVRLMRQWGAGERPDAPSDELDQFEEYNRREGALWNETVIGALDPAGVPIAVTKVRSSGGVGWVEDVYTAPAARRLGHARMLVTHATELLCAAGNDFIFIIADDNDWPKTLYAKIGFAPVGYSRTFHLDLDPQ